MLSACKPSDDRAQFPNRLHGPSERKLTEAAYDVHPTFYPPSPENISVTKEGYKINRAHVTVEFEQETTIGEVNSILEELDARIVSMSKGK